MNRDVCHINLCKACEGEHPSDESLEHRVVPFRNRGSTFSCPNHSPKIWEFHFEACDGQICSLCFIWWTLTSQETDFVKHFENKKEIKEDVQ